MNLELHERPFVSVSGEAGFFTQGSICTFIRFQGCHLRCLYCDTVRAQRRGEGVTRSMETVIRECFTKQVLITGGEPLIQEECPHLIKELISAGHTVQVETNGSLPIPTIPGIEQGGGWVVDRKGPSSGVSALMPKRQKAEELYQWDKNPVVFKYVIASITSPYYLSDREFLFGDMKELADCGYKGKFIISPMYADVKNSGDLFCYPLELQDRVIISLQIHKLMGVA